MYVCVCFVVQMQTNNNKKNAFFMCFVCCIGLWLLSDRFQREWETNKDCVYDLFIYLFRNRIFGCFIAMPSNHDVYVQQDMTHVYQLNRYHVCQLNMKHVWQLKNRLLQKEKT